MSIIVLTRLSPATNMITKRSYPLKQVTSVTQLILVRQTLFVVVVIVVGIIIAIIVGIVVGNILLALLGALLLELSQSKINLPASLLGLSYHSSLLCPSVVLIPPPCGGGSSVVGVSPIGIQPCRE
jgi:hypothetical protein